MVVFVTNNTAVSVVVVVEIVVVMVVTAVNQTPQDYNNVVIINVHHSCDAGDGNNNTGDGGRYTGLRVTGPLSLTMPMLTWRLHQQQGPHTNHSC